MRKILKGIITSVFALSLILPAVVTTNAATTAITVKNITELNTALTNIGAGGTITIDGSGGATIDAVAAINITQSLKIVGISGATINLSAWGITINSDNVTLEGLNIKAIKENTLDSITPSVFGSIYIKGSNVQILNNNISVTKAYDNKVKNSIGINATQSHNVLIQGNTISPASSSGGSAFHIDYSCSNVTMSQNIIKGTFTRHAVFDSSGLFNNNTFDSTYTTTGYQYPSMDGFYMRVANRLDSTGAISVTNITNNSFLNPNQTACIQVDNDSNPCSVVLGGNTYYTRLRDGYVIGAIYKTTPFTSKAANVTNYSSEVNKFAKSGYVFLDESNVTNNKITYAYAYDPIGTTPTDPTIPPTGFWPGYYYPPTTTTPATKVDDPFVYVFKDTPIVTPPTTTTPDTTSKTTKTDRTSRSTRSSRTANAVINASNKTLVSGSSFNFKEGVTAFDNGGNGDTLTNKVTVTGSINTQKAGTYPITYKVTGANGVTVSKVITVTVKAK